MDGIVLNTKEVWNLRHAIALVHCLQRERGASSVVVSSTPTSRVQKRTRARQMTDHAFRPLSMLSKERQSILRIRKILDECDENTKPSFHRVLTLYKVNIQSILHLLVLKITEKHKKTTIRTDSNAVTRSGSHSALSDLYEAKRRETNGPGHRRLASGSRMFRPNSDPEGELRGLAFAVMDPPEKLPEVDDMSEGSTSTRNQASTILPKLLSILDALVKLKESIGVERATLSSILLADKVDHRLMLNDVVLEVAAQKRLLQTLSVLTVGDLQDLVQELVSLSPRIQHFHQKLIERYDINALKLDFSSHRELWKILTLYMDKLHAIELMLLEEIEFLADANVTKNEQSNATIEGLLGLTTGLSNSELRDQVLSSSAESIKNKLLAALDSKPCLSKRLTSRGSSLLSLQLEDEGAMENAKIDGASAKEWEIGIYEIEFIRRIGEGSAGTTYLASWSGLNVAVKVASISDLGLEGWQTEVQALQRLHHPNIIRLLGCVHRENPMTFCLVLEYCSIGDLHYVLHQKTPKNFFFTVAQDVAKGMSYLHRRGIMHRDIKPSNILLDGTLETGGYSVKLTDFGMALELSLAGDRTAETGTYRWMAPEIIRHEPYGEAADVFSYAVVLWQLITREIPFDGQSQVEAAAAVALEEKRMDFPPVTPNKVQDLICRCWDANPNKRPSFDTIKGSLVEIAESLSSEEKKWLDAPLGHQLSRTKRNDNRQEPRPPNLENLQRKKKGIRSLFNRKSVYF